MQRRETGQTALHQYAPTMQTARFTNIARTGKIVQKRTVLIAATTAITDRDTTRAVEPDVDMGITEEAIANPQKERRLSLTE